MVASASLADSARVSSSARTAHQCTLMMEHTHGDVERIIAVGQPSVHAHFWWTVNVEEQVEAIDASATHVMARHSALSTENLPIVSNGPLA